MDTELAGHRATRCASSASSREDSGVVRVEVQDVDAVSLGSSMHLAANAWTFRLRLDLVRKLAAGGMIDKTSLLWSLRPSDRAASLSSNQRT